MKRSVLSHAKWWATQWPFPQSERGWRALTSFVLIFALGLVGTTIAWATIAGNTSLVLFTVGFTCIALIAFGLVPILNLIGRRRSRILSRQFPSDIVVTAYFSGSIMDWIGQKSDRESALSRADMTVSIVFSKAGASFWRGVWRPLQIGAFGWSLIRAVEAVEHTRRGVEVGEVALSLNGQGEPLTFSLVPSRARGISVPKRDELLPLIHRLKQLRAQFTDSAGS